MQKVDFRYSDSDFVSYLMSLNYKHQYVEIVIDRYGKYKAFVHFYEAKEELIRHFNEYINGEAKIDIQKFSKNRRYISNLIKSEILKFQTQESVIE